MALKKTGKSAKKQTEERKEVTAEEEDFDVYTPTAEDADEADSTDDSDFHKLVEGSTRLVVLPPLAKWGIKKPWVKSSSHFFGDDIVKIIGQDLPEEIPMMIGCAKKIRGEKCGVCEASDKWKRSRNKREKALGDKMWAGDRYTMNVVVISEGKNIIPPERRKPKMFSFGKKIYSPLNDALNDGEIFCSPSGLLQVRITRVGSGMSTSYDPPPKVLTTKETIPLDREWLKNMADLRDAAPNTLDYDEVRRLMELLIADADEDIDSAIDDVDDELPF